VRDAAAATDARLRPEVERICDALCETVDGDFAVRVAVEADDETAQKLGMLSNFVLQQARTAIRELSEMKAGLERAVAERTRELELVIEGTDDGVWLQDLRTRALRLSPRAARLLGLPSDAAASWPDVLARIHPHDRASAAAAMEELAAGRRARMSVDFRMRRHDGLHSWLSMRGAGGTAAGSPGLAAGTVADLTASRGLDPDTGLYRDGYLAEAVQDRIDEGRGGSVLVVRLGRFASLASALDPASVVRLRSAAAERVRAVAPEAPLARFGTDGLALLLDDRDPVEAAARLRAAFSAPFRLPQGEEVWLQVGCGAAAFGPGSGASAGQAMGDALAASRQAARADGGYVAFDEAVRSASRRELDDDRLVREAVREGWLTAHLQPIVRLADRSVVGYEALARIVHPERGLIPPGAFLPAAERCGLMSEVAALVLAAALDWSAAARASGGPERFVNVNLAASDLARPALARTILDELARRALPPRALKVEVTEGAVIRDVAEAVRTLGALREAGVAVALDDFGTGYSSLSYLRRLPIDAIKLDRSFVTGIDATPDARAVARTVCDLGRALSLDVVAEGIETETEAGLVSLIGAGYGQGYLFGRPTAPADLARGGA